MNLKELFRELEVSSSYEYKKMAWARPTTAVSKEATKEEP